MRVAAVVPAHNEVLHIGQVIETMPEFVDLIVIIDDASTDGTADRARAEGDPRVVVITHTLNTGVGGAVVSGHRRVLEEGCDIAVVVPGDAQADPHLMPHLLKPVANRSYDYAKGNRFFTVDSYVGMPRNRIVGNIMLSFATKFASGYYNIFDSQMGYTAISTDVLRRLPLNRISEGYSFENDMLIYLNILRAKVIDVAIPARYGEEVSGIRIHRVVPEMIRLLSAGLFRRLWLKYFFWSFGPVAIMLACALFAGLLSAFVGVLALTASIGEPSISAGTATLIILPALFSVLCLALALHLDMTDSPGTSVAISFQSGQVLGND